MKRNVFWFGFVLISTVALSSAYLGSPVPGTDAALLGWTLGFLDLD